jgi:hypothetical protein
MNDTLLWVRRHLLLLTAVGNSGLAALSVFLFHWPGTTTSAVAAAVAAVLGFVAMIGLVGPDKLAPALVGVLKAILYVAVAFGASGPWADPASQLILITAVEAAANLLLGNMVTANITSSGARIE